MSAIRAASVLAIWGAAYRAGTASPDAVLAALADTGRTAGVRAADADTAAKSALPGPGEATAGTIALLQVLRAGGQPVLLLPIAGDVRGFAPKSPALLPALDAGAAIALPATGLAVIPDDRLWRVHTLGLSAPSAPSGQQALFEVERELDSAIRAATARLHTLDVARGSDGVRQQIAQRMRDAAIALPPGDSKAHRHASALLAKVISLEALLDVAAGHDTAAVSRYELAAVDDALRPLMSAVRTGRLAAVAELVGSSCAEAAQHQVLRNARLASEITD